MADFADVNLGYDSPSIRQLEIKAGGLLTNVYAIRLINEAIKENPDHDLLRDYSDKSSLTLYATGLELNNETLATTLGNLGISMDNAKSLFDIDLDSPAKPDEKQQDKKPKRTNL